MDTASEIVLVSYASFTSSPPTEFQTSSSGEIGPPEKCSVTVISDLKKDLSNISSTTSVNSLHDLEAFRHQIYGKPLVLFVHCGKHVPFGQRLNSRGEYMGPRDLEWWVTPARTPWRDPYVSYGTGTTSLYAERFLRTEFMVNLNTSHANIRAFLDRGFQQAEKLLNKKERFALEFDLNPVLRRWWRSQGPARWDSFECLEMTATVGASFTITNYSPPNHVFDCHALWVACWPCYCLSALPYKLWRNVIQEVHDVTVRLDSGCIMVAHPNKPGYTTRELFSQEGVLDSQPGASIGASKAEVHYGRQLQAFQQQNASENRRFRLS